MKLLVLFALLIAVASAQRKLVCYFGSWSTYRPDDGKFVIEDIDPYMCTHAIYAFIGLNSDGTIQILDRWGDIDNHGFQRFNNLRNTNPNLKTLIAIGGWNEPSNEFSRVTKDPTLRSKFVTNVYNFVKQYGFSGLDLDWEYPARRGGAPEDKVNFVSLVRELSAKFKPEGLLLTAAVSASVNEMSISYDVPALYPHLDLIHLMTYDFHGPWEHHTGIHSALYASSVDQDPNLNADATVRHWINAGAPPSKLVLGASAYGKSFTLKNPDSPGLGAEASGYGHPGPWLFESGTLGYNEICYLKYPGGYSPNWAAQQKVPFTFRGDQWVGYENIESIKYKAQYVKDNQLAGMLVWSIDTDDKHNYCGKGSMPLLNTMKRELGN